MYLSVIITFILLVLLIAAIVVATRIYARLTGERAENARLNECLGAERTENARLAERLTILSETHAELERQSEERFKALANQVLVDSSRTLAENHRASIGEMLQPMKADFEQFKRTFTESYSAEARERFSLADRIRELVELNRTISGETRRLTDALKGNSRMQGDWGEMILENILDRAGMRRGYEYDVQSVTTNEQGSRLRPDVIVHLPGKRCIVVDSKVSVQSYLAMIETDNADQAQIHGRAHVNSVKKHIAELRTKNYQDFAGDKEKIDFVMMFIPHEGAYLSAMNLDPTLWQTAYDSRVIIISPTHLMSVIKLVEQMWTQENRTANADRIALEAGRMLDKFRGFLEDMDKMDRNIRSLRDNWDSAFGKLTAGPGNLVGKAEKLRQLGVKSAKPLPERYTATQDDEADEPASAGA